MIDLGNYGFIDLGVSKGSGSMYANKHLLWKDGIGVDIDKDKVEEAIKQGFNAIQGDATSLNNIFYGITSNALASHFLEHLPNPTVAYKCIQSVSGHISDRMHIMQPCFDHMDILASNGLKYFWSDWSGHPNMMTFEEWLSISVMLIDRDNLFDSILFGYSKPITGVLDPALLPLDSPRNSQSYDANIHSKKEDKPLGLDLYREVRLILSKSEDSDLLSKAKNYDLYPRFLVKKGRPVYFFE